MVSPARASVVSPVVSDAHEYSLFRGHGTFFFVFFRHHHRPSTCRLALCYQTGYRFVGNFQCKPLQRRYSGRSNCGCATKFSPAHKTAAAAVAGTFTCSFSGIVGDTRSELLPPLLLLLGLLLVLLLVIPVIAACAAVSESPGRIAQRRGIPLLDLLARLLVFILLN